MNDVDRLPPSRFDFQTDRLHLRLLDEGDERLYCSLYADHETMRFIGEPLSRERALRSMPKAIAAAARSPPRGVFMVVHERATQRPIGICGISRFDTGMTRAEVGIMLESKSRSKGYGSELLEALVEQAFRMFPINEIRVQCSAMNPVVERMVNGLGFTLCSDPAIFLGPLRQRNWSIHRPGCRCSHETHRQEVPHVQRHPFS